MFGEFGLLAPDFSTLFAGRCCSHSARQKFVKEADLARRQHSLKVRHYLLNSLAEHGNNVWIWPVGCFAC
jgi:hypothetical protein